MQTTDACLQNFTLVTWEGRTSLVRQKLLSRAFRAIVNSRNPYYVPTVLLL